MTSGVLIYVLSSFAVSLGLLVNPDLKDTPYHIVFQIAGFLNNTGILTFPFTVAMRYFYYFWKVVLEREVRKPYWFSFCAIFWILVLALGACQAALSLFCLRNNFQSTSQFFSTDSLIRVNTLAYILLIILGGAAHLLFSALILVKFISSTNSGKNSRDSSLPLTSGRRSVSRKAILMKFVPVSITYIFSHIPLLVMTVIELSSGEPVGLFLQWMNTAMYAVSSLMAPILIISTNKNMLTSFKSLMQSLTSKFY